MEKILPFLHLMVHVAVINGVSTYTSASFALDDSSPIILGYETILPGTESYLTTNLVNQHQERLSTESINVELSLQEATDRNTNIQTLLDVESNEGTKIADKITLPSLSTEKTRTVFSTDLVTEEIILTTRTVKDEKNTTEIAEDVKNDTLSFIKYFTSSQIPPTNGEDIRTTITSVEQDIYLHVESEVTSPSNSLLTTLKALKDNNGEEVIFFTDSVEIEKTPSSTSKISKKYTEKIVREQLTTTQSYRYTQDGRRTEKEDFSKHMNHIKIGVQPLGTLYYPGKLNPNDITYDDETIEDIEHDDEDYHARFRNSFYDRRRNINHAAVWITVGFIVVLLTYILALFIHEKGRAQWRAATQNYRRFENEESETDVESGSRIQELTCQIEDSERSQHQS